MGLNCSHDAFDGAYSAFGRMRRDMIKPLGGSYPPHEDPSLARDEWVYDDEKIPQEHDQGLRLFFSHSDCDGGFTPEEAGKVAEFFFWYLNQGFEDPEAIGHLAAIGPKVSASIRKFAEGCRLACEENADLTFR